MVCCIVFVLIIIVDMTIVEFNMPEKPCAFWTMAVVTWGRGNRHAAVLHD